MKLSDFTPKVTSPKAWVGSISGVVLLSLVVGLGLWVVSQITSRVPGAGPFFWRPNQDSATAPIVATGPVFRTYGV